MKMIKAASLVARAGAMTMLAIMAGTAKSQGNLVYANSTTFQGANFYYGNGSAGNEVMLAGTGPSSLITSFTLQFALVGNGAANPSGNEAVALRFYQNDGSLVSGIPSPNTALYDSGFVTLNQVGLQTFTLGSTLTYDSSMLGGGVVVPNDFTWAVTFANISPDELAGLALFSPATVGNNFGDAWVNTGSGWQLQSAGSGNPPMEFGVQISGNSVPEPGSLCLALMAVVIGFACRTKWAGRAS